MGGTKPRLWQSAFLALVILTFRGQPALAQTLNLETNNLQANSFALCPYNRTFDGQWLGVTLASDGNCYFGSSTHDDKHGAGFFRYSPATGGVTMLAEDLTAVCGEDVRFTPPQGKLHSPIVEFNGWLYFSTHLGNYWIEAENAFTGGHVLGYELATGKFRDFGVVRSNYTCYSAVGVDKVRNKLLSFVTRFWGPVEDSHICRIDITSGAIEDLGVVPGLNCFWFFVDVRGDCWFSCERDNGSLRVIRSATGAMEVFSGALPDPGLGSSRWSSWGQALPDGNSCVFSFYQGNTLHLFRADVFATNQLAAFTTVRDIGPAENGLVAGGDRVFYMQRANRQVGNEEFTDFHLLSAPIYANTPIIDHGLIVDQSGRLVWRLPGVTADSQGHFYGVGDWWLLPGEQGTIVGTLRHDDVYNSTNYFALPRGEFLGVMDLSPSLVQPRTLSLTSAGGGTVSSDARTNLFFGNAVVNLTAVPSSGWSFLGWSGDADSTNAANVIVMTRDKSVQGVFGAAFTASTNGHGSVSLDPPGGVYPYGTAVRLTATPQAGYYFASWGGSASGSANPITYVMTNGNAGVSASFSVLPGGKVALTANSLGKGRVAVSPQASYYNTGQIVTLTAIPDPGQSFASWSGGANGTNNPLSITLNQSATVTASFTRSPQFQIQFVPGQGKTAPQISFSGDLGAQYRVDATTNLINWEPLGTLTNIFGSLQFTDPGAQNMEHRFYRAVSPP